jgi:hypothetical protein
LADLAYPELVHPDRMRALDAKMVGMPAAIAQGHTDFIAMAMDQEVAQP